jgi:hypothetical protein
MIRSKHLRDTVAAWFLVLLSFSAEAQAEISPRSTGDEGFDADLFSTNP